MLSVACLIKCNLVRQARLPVFKGIVFRDIFSRQFRRAACLYKKGRCDTCRVVSICDYAKYLEMPGRTTVALLKKAPSPPRPFVIDPPATIETMLPARSPFDFQLRLFGSAVNAAPVFIRAFEMMGQAGMGPDKAPFNIKTVSCGQKGVYQPKPSPAVPFQRQPPALPELILPPPEQIRMPTLTGEAGDELFLKIGFVSPLKIKGSCRSSPDLSFQTLIRMMLRRVSLLLDCYGEGVFGVDYKELIDRAGAVRTVASDLSWYDWRSNGSQRDKSLLQNSIIGTVMFQGRLTSFLPLVRLSQKIHIGRKTEFGLGKFTTEVLSYE